MKLAQSQLQQNIFKFVQKYISDYQTTYGHFPTVEKDEDWPSPCIIEPFDQYKNTWQGSEIADELSFDNVESALELKLHNDIKEYFTTIYSESIPAECKEGNLSLLFAWSKDDFARLQENLIGHILMKRRLKQQETVFIAVTDEEDMILSVDNSTGEVWVERVGCKPHKKLANSLTEFLDMLTPHIGLN